MFAIICAVGLAGCLIAVLLLVVSYIRNKSMVLPLILFLVFLLVAGGSIILEWKGVSIGSKSDDDRSPEQQNDDAAANLDEKDAKEALKEALGDNSCQFSDDVSNDTTGRWRLFVYNSEEDIVEHAVEYYNAYFESDDELHWVINKELQTTTSIMYSSGSLFINTHNYVDNEEANATILGGGDLLNTYIVDISSGKISGASTITNESGETVDLDDIESSIIAALPQEYISSNWFYVNCDSFMDESVSVDVQIDQGSNDADAALALAAECFEIAKNEVENTGAVFSIFYITVVDGGSPVGLFSTEDGKNFVSIANGQRSELTFP